MTTRQVLQAFLSALKVLIRDVPNGGVGGRVMHPIFSDLQESWLKGSHAARELAIVFSVTFVF